MTSAPSRQARGGLPGDPGAEGSSPRRRRALGTAARALRALSRTAVAAGLVVAGCRGEATGPAATAVRLQVVEAPDTVEAGSGIPATVRVRAEDGDGEPVEGVRLRFTATAGGGALEPPSGVTGGDGEAAASYLPGPGPGTARLRVDAPDAPDVAPLVRTVVHRASRRLSLQAAAGDGQEAEAGSQLPRPLRVRVRRADGSVAAGEPVEWSLAAGPAGARIEPLSARTDTAGVAAALLTLGAEPGIHRIRVHGSGTAVATDTLLLRARGVASLESSIRLDSVRPLPLVPGDEATVHGAGFPAGGGEVRVDGRPAELIGIGGGRLRVRVPEPGRCAPTRRVGVRVLVGGGGMSNAAMVPMRGSGVAMELEPGEIRTLEASEAECLQLPAGDRARSLRLVVQSAATAAAGQLELELTARAAAGSAAAHRPPAGLAGGGETTPAALPGGGGRGLRVPAAGSGPVLRIQSGARRELRSRAVPPAAAVPAGPLPTGAATPVDVGDLLELHFAVGGDLSVSCADTTGGVTARVRARRPSVVMAQDTGTVGFSDADHELLAREFDELVFPTDTAYFGAPTDLDGNGRVIVLFTHRVNELTPAGADAAVGGFFLPLDLAEAGDGDPAGVPGPGGETCPASNEAEVLYLPVPDPQGLHGPEFSRAEALRNARAIAAHELMHLLSAGRRVVTSDRGFLALDEVWLAEALSHLAEEVVGLAFLGQEPGSGLDFADFAGTRSGLEAFNTFHLQNFGRLQLYLLDPAATPALSLADPGGLPGLRMRGFGWLFVRWLADRFGARATERPFVRSLSLGGPARLAGIENVTAATGTSWEELLRDFALVPLLEGSELPPGDAGSAARRDRARVSTWRLRATYEGLSDNPGARSIFPVGYPLRPENLPFADARRAVTLRPAGAAYFSLEAVGSTPALALALRDSGGSGLPAGAGLRLTLVRVR